MTRYVISVCIKVFVNNVCILNSSGLEHFHQCSVCEPALEILDEVHQSNPENPLEDLCEETQNTQLSRDLEESINTVESYWLTAPCCF